MTDEKESAPAEGGAEPRKEGDGPPDNEFQGRGLGKKKKKAEKNKRPPKTQVEEQIDAALAKSSIQSKKQLAKKKRFKYGLIAGGVLLLGYGVFWMMKPYEGSIAWGICKVFVEGMVRYPQYLRFSTVEEFETSVRIWYTQIDSFGEYRMDQVQCYYKQDPERGTIVDKVLLNRREVDRKMVDDFNRALPTIISFPPDLTIPAPLPDSLQDLQIDTQKFRKPII
jgi:hypothetical protein